jgi:hypothetical protein
MNSFIEGNIMDSFQTEMGAEVYYNRNGWVSMLGVTNGNMNQTVKEAPINASPAILAKFGYDKQIDKDLRVRLTGSLNHTARMGNGNPWSEDRAGSRYYAVTTANAYTYNGTTVASDYAAASGDTEGNPSTGRYQPGYKGWYTAMMFNPFVKYKGLEFFGTIELTKGGTGVSGAARDTSRSVNQFVGDVVYRFGNNENLYVGARYGTVTGDLETKDVSANINRLEASAGWFMTKNILAKLAYVDQKYNNFAQTTATSPVSGLYGQKFSGLMFEAVIAF